jgi:hypothetical protein
MILRLSSAEIMRRALLNTYAALNEERER